MNPLKKIERFINDRRDNREAILEMMQILVRTLDERDEYTRGHSERVATLSVDIGKELHLNPKRLETLYRGGLLHDIGKIGIRDEILYKPGSFTQEERASMNQHPEKGHLIVLHSHLLWDLIPIIRNHHENYDGSGYPDKLKGEAIPLEARIVCLADYFDALATPRPYKKPYTREDSCAYVRNKSGQKFDPKVVEAFFTVVDNFYTKHIAPLNYF